MKRNIIIVLEAIAIIVLGLLLYRSGCLESRGGPGRVFTWPEVSLRENERIVSAYASFRTTYIKSIRNIPPEWYIDLDLDVPPNPEFKGHIIVGAAALTSAKQLPLLRQYHLVFVIEMVEVRGHDYYTVQVEVVKGRITGCSGAARFFAVPSSSKVIFPPLISSCLWGEKLEFLLHIPLFHA